MQSKALLAKSWTERDTNSVLVIEYWILKFTWNLEIGVWNFTECNNYYFKFYASYIRKNILKNLQEFRRNIAWQKLLE